MSKIAALCFVIGLILISAALFFRLKLEQTAHRADLAKIDEYKEQTWINGFLYSQALYINVNQARIDEAHPHLQMALLFAKAQRPGLVIVEASKAIDVFLSDVPIYKADSCYLGRYEESTTQR
jgi:hypothetical protein